MTDKTHELLPCPFCGSEQLSIFHDDLCRSCEILCECGCHICFSDDEIKEEELEKHVIEKWNTHTKCPECEEKQKIIDDISYRLGEILVSMQMPTLRCTNPTIEKRWKELKVLLDLFK